MKNLFLPIAAILFLFQTEITKAQQTLFTLQHPDSTGMLFFNLINDTKQLNVMTNEYYYNGGGVAIGDVNNDGLPDIFFSANVMDCKLFINEGNLKFKDVTKEAGVTATGDYHTGTVMVDINNDGWMDIYVCQSTDGDPEKRRNKLFVNNKNGTFINRAKEYGVDDAGYSIEAFFNDMDNDGDLDLLVLNYPYQIQYAKTVHLTYDAKEVLVLAPDIIRPYESDRYYENINGKYFDKTHEAGLETHSFGLSAVLQDFNGDGLTDIYQANDYLKPDYLFINKGNGKFVNEFADYFGHCPYFSMGTDYADINNDGLSDLIAVDMLPEGNDRQKQLGGPNNFDEFEKMMMYGNGYQYVKNVVQLNNGNNTYSDISYFTGMAASEWSWAVLTADFDLDGWKDVYITNGYLRDITNIDYMKFKLDSLNKELKKIKSDSDVVKLVSNIPQVKVLKAYFKNYGGLNFKREVKSTGLDQFAWSFGAAYADLDNDGDLDIVVNNTNDYAFLLKNNTIENKTGASVRLKLNGTVNNIHGIGTKIVAVTPDHLTQTLIFNPMKGYLSSHDNTILIGFGKYTTMDLNITWPDGKTQPLNGVTPNQLLTINYTDATDVIADLTAIAPLFKDVTADTKINYTYAENSYIDFKLEPLLPHRFSQLGPCITVADFNGDKLDDIFVGGAKDHAAVLFFQNADATFTQSTPAIFTTDKMHEDGACTAVDIDGDGDNDLIVTSGGNDYPNDNTKYPVRFYLNDGKGNFSGSKYSSKFFVSANTIVVNDFNKDGKSDFFIGGRTVPGHYGLIPNSYILSIQNDSLIDINTSPSLHSAGMVTTASWADMNGDGWTDLVLTGEWLPMTIYYNNNGIISDRPTLLDHTSGWWNKIVTADIDLDGDLDIIGGNLGMNTRYRGTIDKPVTMVASDFDNNGSTDCLVSTYVKGKSYPIAFRDNVLDQMPYLRKKFLRYHQYANATIQDIFTEEQIMKADKFIADLMYSTVFINDGKGTFAQVNLPAQAQFAPVNGIQITDINNDKIPDLLLAGNNYSTEVETGRNDAGIGLALLGLVDGSFAPMPVTLSGFFVPGDVKCLEKIIVNGKTIFIAGKNKGQLQFVGGVK